MWSETRKKRRWKRCGVGGGEGRFIRTGDAREGRCHHSRSTARLACCPDQANQARGSRPRLLWSRPPDPARRRNFAAVQYRTVLLRGTTATFAANQTDHTELLPYRNSASFLHFRSTRLFGRLYKKPALAPPSHPTFPSFLSSISHTTRSTPF